MPKSRVRPKKGCPGRSSRIVVMKVNPFTKKIVPIRIKPTTPGVRGILGLGTIRHHVILSDVNGEKLVAGVRVGLDPDLKIPEWRIRGCENYAGSGILFGSRGGSMEYMGDCPVDVAWLEREIIWCGPGEDAPAAEVAERRGIPLMQDGGEVGEKTQDPLLEAENTQAGEADDGGGGSADLAGDASASR